MSTSCSGELKIKSTSFTAAPSDWQVKKQIWPYAKNWDILNKSYHCPKMVYIAVVCANDADGVANSLDSEL